jgi:hypothetical protein
MGSVVVVVVVVEYKIFGKNELREREAPSF